MKNNRSNIFILLFIIVALVGCNNSASNKAKTGSSLDLDMEPLWIRRGNPIEFEGKRWFPQDGIETLLATEVYSLGE